MKNYRLVVDFHAENDQDAKAQARAALMVSFDDGYEGHRLTEGERLVYGKATLEND